MLFGNIKHETSGKNDNILEISLLPNATIIANASCILWHQTDIRIEVLPNDGYEETISSEADQEQENAEVQNEEQIYYEEPEPPTHPEEEPQLPEEKIHEEEITNIAEPNLTTEIEEEHDTSEEIENQSLIEKFWDVVKKGFEKVTQQLKKSQPQEEPVADTDEPNPYEVEAPQYLETELHSLDNINENEAENPEENLTIENEPTYPFLWAHCTNTSQEAEALIKLTNSHGGEIMILDLASLDNQEVIVQANNFVCAMKGIQISLFLQHDSIVARNTNQPFTLLKLQGEKLVFLQSTDEIFEEELDNDAIRVNLAHIIAFDNGIEIDLNKLQTYANPFHQAPTYTVILAGTGRVWLQNKPICILGIPTQPANEQEPAIQADSQAVIPDTDTAHNEPESEPNLESPPIPWENPSLNEAELSAETITQDDAHPTSEAEAAYDYDSENNPYLDLDMEELEKLAQQAAAEGTLDFDKNPDEE